MSARYSNQVQERLELEENTITDEAMNLSFFSPLREEMQSQLKEIKNECACE